MPAAPTPTAVPGRRISGALTATVSLAPLSFTARIVAAAILGVIAFGVTYAQLLADAAAGSRTAFLVVVPVLVALIATGYRSAPRGVGDAESDWIVATLVGVGGFSAIVLLAERIPTLAALWRLHLLGAALWFACCLTVLFGVRHVARMWPLWLFALVATTPLPYLMATAALGGTDTAAAAVAAAFGSVAVFLATRAAGTRVRLIAAAGTFTAALAVVLAAGDHIGLLVTIVVAGGIIPVAAVVVSGVRSGSATTTTDLRTVLPHRSAVSVAILAVGAVALLAITPVPGQPRAAPTAAADWPDRAHLGAPTPFPFIPRFLGPDATLSRYDVPSSPGLPAAAVDVLSTPNPAALEDLADAVWYPSSTPIDIRLDSGSPGMPAGARILYSNADAATGSAGLDWYAVTWIWRTGVRYQRVTVITSQRIDGTQPPPAPQPISLRDTALRPAAWLARQQPDEHGNVDPAVTARAAEVVALVTSSGAEAPR